MCIYIYAKLKRINGKNTKNNNKISLVGVAQWIEY